MTSSAVQRPLLLLSPSSSSRRCVICEGMPPPYACGLAEVQSVFSTMIGCASAVVVSTGREVCSLPDWSDAIGMGSSVMVTLPALLPCEHALAPGVHEAEEKDRDEDEHRHEAAQKHVAEDDRPQVDEDDLYVERDE